MKTVVNISGGAGSTEAFFRCLDQGRDVVPVFADTMSETPELYQLLDDIERISGMKIHRLSSGRNIWDVFNEFGVIRIAKTQTCKASFELKKKPLANFTQKRWSPEECVIATGLSWMEKDRQERLVAAMDPYQPYFPLNERPLLSQCELIDKLKERGITTQSLYEKGYPHNNCAGACVLAGIKQWAGLYHDNPSLFANAEQREQAWQEKHESDFTILRDQSEDQVRSYTLRQLREDIEAGKPINDQWRSVCGCMDIEMPLFKGVEIDDGCD